MVIHDPHAKVIIEQPKVADILCNRCGASCLKRISAEAEGDFYGLCAEFSTGYLSEDLPDGQTHRFHLCERCLLELERGFVHPPEVNDRGGGS